MSPALAQYFSYSTLQVYPPLLAQRAQSVQYLPDEIERCDLDSIPIPRDEFLRVFTCILNPQR